ncbi:PH domain-containing protein [Curtobacterium sp. Leaf261]|uniref:PH domain-containing protein n=1 Tax=Curtobacterium sp. Leaf261 TaxID=1736311 RepID=UPI0006F4FFA5|nr:PH domain-containing protein [Curtobacterium sp. Leaf261]KQO62185.1 hypothetical protein ASF23_10170 [Curtobacterium sp. Leaf261]
MTDRWPLGDGWPGEQPDGHRDDTRPASGLEARGRFPDDTATPTRPTWADAAPARPTWDSAAPAGSAASAGSPRSPRSSRDDEGLSRDDAGPGADEREPERVIARFRPHARRLFWPVVWAFVVGVGGGFGLGVFRAEWAWVNLVVAGLTLLLLLIGSVAPLVRWLGHRTLVTTRRLVITSGLVVRHRHELLHSRGYDVTVRRTGLQGVFRTGDVLVFPGEDRPLVIADVPSADLVVAVLHDLVEAHDRPRPRSGPRWDDIIGGGPGRPF